MGVKHTFIASQGAKADGVIESTWGVCGNEEFLTSALCGSLLQLLQLLSSEIPHHGVILTLRQMYSVLADITCGGNR